MTYSRRTALTVMGATVIGGVGTATARLPRTTGDDGRGDGTSKGVIRKMGHSLLSDPVGGYAEESIRSDGQYAVVGSFFGEGGSFLVDISNPRDPTEAHRLPSSAAVVNTDVTFDRRDGIYYRSQEPTSELPFAGVEVVDYGWGDGTPEDPEIVAVLEARATHNLFAHPEADVVYTVNGYRDPEDFDDPGSIDVWNVSDPLDPEYLGEFGPNSYLQDVVVDPERELMHCAFSNAAVFEGYVIMDVSDPMRPEEVGRFDYAGRQHYSEERLNNGEPGFQHCNYANYDPERGLAFVGDEKGLGAPGGKHVFDIGWGDGSVNDPQHVGFTYSPNAKVMDPDAEDPEFLDWTGHNFDVIPKDDTTMLISGDYHEGAVVYDVSDPTDPTATDRYETTDEADVVAETGTGPIFPVGDPPMAWGADYADERDLTVVSDMVTGLYVFRITPSVAKKD